MWVTDLLIFTYLVSGGLLWLEGRAVIHQSEGKAVYMQKSSPFISTDLKEGSQWVRFTNKLFCVIV